jgi:protoporphyrinogen oxidase
MVRGYARALEERALGSSPGPSDYREWLASRFGGPMCRAFFYPYNRKAWRIPLEEMVPSWADWSIPLPTYEEVLAGAAGERREGYGYNASFLYPRKGGIGSLVARMAAPVHGRTTLSFDAARIDLRRREVKDREGRAVRYDRLVSTVPLPALCAMAEGLPAELRRGGALLRWTRILTVNWGVRGTADTGHWCYAPDRDVPYFRVGCLSAVDRGSAPEGFSSLFTDTAFPGGGGRIAVAREVERCRAALARQGVIRRPADAVVASPVLLDPGYVVFDRNRAPAVAALSRFLAGRGVALAGRYGLWDYFGMERSILSGFRAADEALGG